MPGLPLVNIGFHQHLAWGPTGDTAEHFTLHRLQPDPKDFTPYLLDGQTVAMGKQQGGGDVEEGDGRPKEGARLGYSS
ncbi:penicillin acylase family protein, partial [Pseudomonas syringae]|uniref:penicillin acylase family protein n=1 Tax=Pseudomonas syringae TaxID=317 RepID=UPI0019D70928